MDKKQIRILSWVAVAIFVVAAIASFVLNNTQVFNPAKTEQKATEKAGVKNTGNVAPVAQISYAEALIKYADRRIQLDTVCQAHPYTVTYKDNTGIMIDNRSPNTRTVKVGTTFTIKPWSFKIVVLPDVLLKSKTLLVNCDQSVNVATVLVQE